MPKELHDRLYKQGRAKGLSGDRLNAYVFGTMERIKKRKQGKRNG